MAADEDTAKAGKSNEERRSGGDRRQRPPVTIDLKAEASEPQASPSPSPSPSPSGSTTSPPPGSPSPSPVKEGAARSRTPPPPSQREGLLRAGAAGVAGGVFALVLVVVLQATGLLPVPGRTAATRASATAQSAADAATALDRRVTAIEAMTADLPTLRADSAKLDARIAALETAAGSTATKGDVEGLAGKVADLASRLDSLPAAASAADLTALSARVTRLETSMTGTEAVPAGAASALAGRLDAAEASVARLSKRVAALEDKMAALTAASGAMGESETAARTIAAVSLRQAVEAGQPFATDLDMAAALGMAGDNIDALRPFAANGVATREALAAEFPAVADAILAVTKSKQSGGSLVDRMVGSLAGLVTVRPSGPVAGNDPPAIVSRIKAAVAKGDFATALSERDGLPAAGKQASAEWAAKAADRVKVDALVAKIAAAAVSGG